MVVVNTDLSQTNHWQLTDDGILLDGILDSINREIISMMHK